MVLFGSIADAANEKLASEIPDLFVIASESFPVFMYLFCESLFVPTWIDVLVLLLNVLSVWWCYIRNRAERRWFWEVLRSGPIEHHPTNHWAGNQTHTHTYKMSIYVMFNILIWGKQFEFINLFLIRSQISSCRGRCWVCMQGKLLWNDCIEGWAVYKQNPVLSLWGRVVWRANDMASGYSNFHTGMGSTRWERWLWCDS